jgi:hypothetical protein
MDGQRASGLRLCARTGELKSSTANVGTVREGAKARAIRGGMRDGLKKEQLMLPRSARRVFKT